MATKSKQAQSETHEHDFALIVGGVHELSPIVTDALFNAGCDDATPSIQHGRLYMEFSRSAASLEDAILSAIRDVEGAGIGARVLRVDENDLVSASEIARRIDRSRQLVHQYITGQRGPGDFPPPACHLMDHAPLWAWCAVSHWLVEHQLLRAEESRNAQVVRTINLVLDNRQHPPPADLLKHVQKALNRAG